MVTIPFLPETSEAFHNTYGRSSNHLQNYLLTSTKSDRSRLSETEPMPESVNRIVRDILDNRLSIEEISPSGELLRAISRHLGDRAHQERQGVSEDSPASRRRAERPQAIREAMDRARNYRRARYMQRYSDTGSQSLNTSNSGQHPSNETATDRSSSTPASLRPTAGESRARSSNSALQSSGSLSDSRRSEWRNAITADIQRAGDELETMSTHLRILLDEPITPAPPADRARDFTEVDGTFRASKRRKTDADHSAGEFQGFSYGHFGQVEPGELKMEIESCDGGIFGEGDPTGYAAANVLKSDSSVYCTKGNRCNLVLRHQGGTPFCLTELVIVAPSRGFTAPVQEGMIFISMSSDDLLSRTAQYQIQYSRPAVAEQARSRHDSPSILSIRHNIDGSQQYTGPNACELENGPLRQAQIPAEFAAATTQPFQITTTCSQDDEDDEPSSRREHRTRGRILGRVGDATIDTLDVDDNDSDTSESSTLSQHVYLDLRPPSEPMPASQISAGLAEAIDAAQAATQEAVKAVGGTLMAPHAKFFIKSGKSKCTISFDPPVSGRFVLLKMWSPHHRPGGNIDVQSVVVKGYAGPRYFPAVQLR